MSSTKRFLLTLSLLSVNTFAGELSYENFVDSCSNPAAHGQQKPAESIRLSCKSVVQGWEPIESGSSALQETRVVSTEIFSDKSHVSAESFEVETPELLVSCARFRQVTRTAQIEKAINCEKVTVQQQQTRGLKELCLDAVNEAIAANADLEEVTPTGLTYSTCGEESVAQVHN